jgi:nicotinamidase-related amidase
MTATSSDNQDLHGNAPDRCQVVLLIVDMINALDFPGNEELIRESSRLGRNVAVLKRRCREAGIPAIYVNDNQGKWRSDFAAVIRHCDREGVPGREMVRQVLPDLEDYLVLKPKHSAFYATPLDTLLQYIGVETLILTGISSNSCILLTASDAYVRDYKLFIPSDCVAGHDAEQHRKSLELMKCNFAANINESGLLDLRGLAANDQNPA